ncbi:hypothetical protein FEE96_02050 [Parasedimentitalea maritima]|uniref:5-carboxymethyl-2-hydroxymuconate Delta-isomerase n=1 Tax=Parasedimentitalea maritima TaxID=2578117 RepID=A0ABY2V139_9RHOB|nr:hypothetical protein [Zongyanglinia marina]TLP69092.1 hypothetical protein FEE96_02050 [Zongyanglinia marina]
MPHAEVKYSSDLDIDTRAILTKIEAVILEHDDGAGDCKGRGYPTSEYQYTHIDISVSVLSKPHRDAAFSNALLADLEHSIKALIPMACEFSLGLHYITPFYVTGSHRP